MGIPRVGNLWYFASSNRCNFISLVRKLEKIFCQFWNFIWLRILFHLVLLASNLIRSLISYAWGLCKISSINLVSNSRASQISYHLTISLEASFPFGLNKPNLRQIFLVGFYTISNYVTLWSNLLCCYSTLDTFNLLSSAILHCTYKIFEHPIIWIDIARIHIFFILTSQGCLKFLALTLWSGEFFPCCPYCFQPTI